MTRTNEKNLIYQIAEENVDAIFGYPKVQYAK